MRFAIFALMMMMGVAQCSAKVFAAETKDFKYTANNVRVLSTVNLCATARNTFLANVEAQGDEVDQKNEAILFKEIKRRDVFAQCEATWYK